MNLYPVPVAVAVAIFAGINICFVIAVQIDHIAWCFPYVEGCVSISKAAREMPVQQIYRIFIMIGACLMILYWFLCGGWLNQLKNSEAHGQLFVMIGMLAAVLLVINVALFGDSVGVARTIRRICVAGFFILTAVAQLMYTQQLKNIIKHKAWPGLARVVRAKVIICSGQLVLAGLVLIAPLFEKKRFINNVIEWDFLLLMLIFFVATAVAWKQTGFRFSGFTTTPGQ